MRINLLNEKRTHRKTIDTSLSASEEELAGTIGRFCAGAAVLASGAGMFYAMAHGGSQEILSWIPGETLLCNGVPEDDMLVIGGYLGGMFATPLPALALGYKMTEGAIRLGHLIAGYGRQVFGR